MNMFDQCAINFLSAPSKHASMNVVNLKILAFLKKKYFQIVNHF